MKKLAHRVELSVFIKEEETGALEATTEKLCSFFPLDLDEEKLKLETLTAKGFNEHLIIIKKLVLTKWRHVRAVLEHIMGLLSEEQKATLLRQMRSRLDEESHFYIRFDRKALMEKDQLLLTNSGDCFHIKITLAAYPKTEEAALKIVEEWLSEK